MYLKSLSAVVAMALIVAYYAPVVVKLGDLPLTLVALGGLILATVDAWQSLHAASDRHQKRAGSPPTQDRPTGRRAATAKQ